MKQYEWKKTENCFGGANVYEYKLNIRTGEQFIENIGASGSLKCFRNFPRPFFQLTLPDNTTVKGVINDFIIKVSFPTSNLEENKEKFEILLESLLAELS